jgi:segregation and condensation protein A
MLKFDHTSQQLTFRLTSFEGPLDLLLHLIKQNQMDIYDIKISEITSQYLEYLDQMKSTSLQVAGEYFVMAATLLNIKSKMLLPVHEETVVADPVPEDPRQELVDQLVAHQCFQLAADKLQELAQKRACSFSRPAAQVLLDPKQMLQKHFSLTALERYYGQVLLRQQQHAELKKTRQIKTDNFTIEQESERIKQAVTAASGWIDFRKLFDPTNLVIEQLVTSFLALLELIKRGRIEVSQQVDLGPIKLRSVQDEIKTS